MHAWMHASICDGQKSGAPGSGRNELSLFAPRGPLALATLAASDLLRISATVVSLPQSPRIQARRVSLSGSPAARLGRPKSSVRAELDAQTNQHSGPMRPAILGTARGHAPGDFLAASRVSPCRRAYAAVEPRSPGRQPHFRCISVRGLPGSSCAIATAQLRGSPSL
jgi:hypothetical protein